MQHDHIHNFFDLLDLAPRVEVICLLDALSSTPFNLICIITTFRKKVSIFWPNPRGRGCVQGQNVCLHAVLCFIPFNLICNITTFRNKCLAFNPTKGTEGVCNKNMCLHGVLCPIPFNLICNMTTFRKICIDILTQPQWPKGARRTEYVLA